MFKAHLFPNFRLAIHVKEVSSAEDSYLHSCHGSKFTQNV